MWFELGDFAGQVFQLPAFAVQDAGGGAAANSLRGAVSTAIAGYLQTKGLIDQAKILADFREVLEQIAALFWAFSIALAIGSVAVFGFSRDGLYLLVGPALFYFMITATAETTGTELRFGNYTAPTARGEQTTMLQYIRAIDGELSAAGGEIQLSNPGTVQVSRFFAAWDAIVTEAVHAVIALLVDTENKDHLRFVARERMLNFVLHSSPNDQGFIRLVAAVHFGECAHIMPEIHRNHPVRTQPPLPLANNQSQQHGAQHAMQQWNAPGNPVDVETKAFLLAMKRNGVAGFENVPIEEVTDPYNPSCATLWGYIAAACRHLAQRRMTRSAFFGLFNRGDTSGIPWQQTINDIMEYFGTLVTGGQTDQQRAIDTVGAYIYKNALERTTIAALTTQAFGRVPFNSQEHEEITELMAQTEAHGGFMKLKYFAHAVPYVQGFLLYLLSIAFPFFAILLVVPTRAQAFLGWLGLWAWVKSWDVGFAAVHVARDVLWYMMRGRINMHSEEINWGDPISIIAVIYNNDPFFSQNTYWLIVSALTLAVPFATAHLFLGATGMYQMFAGAIDKTPETFGSDERNRSRRFLANVNEHLQRITSSRIAMAYADAARTQGVWKDNRDKKIAAATKLGSNDEGAATMTGEYLKGGMNGSSYTRHQAAHFTFGKMMSQLGSPKFLAELDQQRSLALQSDTSHFMRGMVPMSSPVAKALRDEKGNVLKDASGAVKYDSDGLKRLEMVFGSEKMSRAMAEKNLTWGELFNMSAEYQLNNQALTAALTGRRMTSPIRSAGDATQLIKTRLQHAQFGNKDPQAATMTAHLPLVGSLFTDMAQLHLPPSQNVGRDPFALVVGDDAVAASRAGGSGQDDEGD